jgi:thiol:disulfide interchange protein
MVGLCSRRWTLASLVMLCVISAWSKHGVVGAEEGLFSPPGRLAADVGGEADVVSVSASFMPPGSEHIAVLYVQARLKPGWHIYSITQPKGGPIASRISLASEQFKPVGEIKVWPKPRRTTEAAFNDLPIETHEGEVVWYLPVSFPPDADPKLVKLEGTLRAQACNAQGCLPPKSYKFIATAGKVPQLPPQAEPALPAKAFSEASGTSGELRQSGSHATIRGHIEPQVVAAGESVRVMLTAEPESPYHVYELESRDTGKGTYKPTLIRLVVPAGWQAGAPQASTQPRERKVAAEDVQRYYEEPVTWTTTVTVPDDATPGEHRLSGVIGYQTCFEQGCDRPLGARFEAMIRVGQASAAGRVPLVFSAAKYRDASPPDDGSGQSIAAEPPAQQAEGAAPADDLNFELAVVGDSELTQRSFFWAIALAFAGGALLNLMPCVLPVIGLKILSFVEQGGHHRSRVLALNVWYSLGLISVFMLLATLAVVYGFGWGELFSYSQFNIALAAVVFAMSLSFLGVWEIPIPGFVGSGKAGELAAKEGVAGAFTKGVVTTVLATPCTGPFLTSALVWAAARPAPLVYAVFFSIGLGMASPYLLIGAFPSLIRWLPKPGAWMETFKQSMGFVLLATLVYLMTFVPWASVIPTLALLIGIWAACWWIGRQQWSSGRHARLIAWGQGLALATVVGFAAFGWLEPVMKYRLNETFEAQLAQQMAAGSEVSPAPNDHISWQPFTIRHFKQLAVADQTILINFTAPWCLTCKTLERTVLDTQPVRELLKTNGVATLQAQWLEEYPDTDLMLKKLKSKQIPVVAIFPAGNWSRPIVLRGPFPRHRYLEALRQAGPSKSTAMAASGLSDSRAVPQ